MRTDALRGQSAVGGVGSRHPVEGAARAPQPPQRRADPGLPAKVSGPHGGAGVARGARRFGSVEAYTDQYQNERALLNETLARRLAQSPATIVSATRDIRAAVLGAAALVLDTRLGAHKLTPVDEKILQGTAAAALTRPHGFPEFVRLCANRSGAPSLEASTAIAVMRHELALRRQYGTLLDEVELLRLLAEHLEPNQRRWHHGNAELLYILTMVERGEVVVRVNPLGKSRDVRCDFSLPDEDGDTLSEVKRCFGGVWDRDLQQKVRRVTHYAVRQIDATAVCWQRRVARQVVVLFFQAELRTPMQQARFAAIRRSCRPPLRGRNLQVAFLPTGPSLEPVTLYDI